MTAHCREDKRLSAKRFDGRDGRPGYRGNIGDTAAANADGDASARGDSCSDFRPVHFRPHSLVDIGHRLVGQRLTHQRQSRILNQYLGKEVAQRLEVGIENIEQNGERRNLSVMFADIRGFTSFSEKSQPEDVFESLNTYLGAMIPAVIEEYGVIDKIIGDEVMAIFGMLPDHADGAACGLRAAVRMLRAIEQLNRTRREQGGELLQIGIGMATGPVSLGVLGSQHRKSITVIGNHVNLAARLQGLAGANELIVDGATFEALGNWQEQFIRRQVELKGFSTRVDTYQLDFQRIEISAGLAPDRKLNA